jgi:hypothetical protein
MLPKIFGFMSQRSRNQTLPSSIAEPKQGNSSGPSAAPMRPLRGLSGALAGRRLSNQIRKELKKNRTATLSQRRKAETWVVAAHCHVKGALTSEQLRTTTKLYLDALQTDDDEAMLQAGLRASLADAFIDEPGDPREGDLDAVLRWRKDVETPLPEEVARLNLSTLSCFLAEVALELAELNESPKHAYFALRKANLEENKFALEALTQKLEMEEKSDSSDLDSVFSFDSGISSVSESQSDDIVESNESSLRCKNKKILTEENIADFFLATSEGDHSGSDSEPALRPDRGDLV